MADITVDTASQSNPHEIATEHIAFDWHVDFDAQTLSGSATYQLKVKKAEVSEVMYVIDLQVTLQQLTRCVDSIRAILRSDPFSLTRALCMLVIFLKPFRDLYLNIRNFSMKSNESILSWDPRYIFVCQRTWG